MDFICTDAKIDFRGLLPEMLKSANSVVPPELISEPRSSSLTCLPSAGGDGAARLSLAPAGAEQETLLHWPASSCSFV